VHHLVVAHDGFLRDSIVAQDTFAKNVLLVGSEEGNEAKSPTVAYEALSVRRSEVKNAIVTVVDERVDRGEPFTPGALRGEALHAPAS
jgi:hypothetical protein